MSFYKMQGQEFYFQLANLSQPLEEYVLWKENEKFPIRDSVNGVSPRDAYWDKNKLPGYRGDRSFIREIIINSWGINTQYAFGFKKRDTDQLNAEISNIINLQRKNPLDFRFKYRKTGQGKETIRVVVAMDEVGLPQNVQQSSVYGDVVPIQKPMGTEQIAPQNIQNPIQPEKVAVIASNVVKTPLHRGFELPKPIPNMQQVVALNDKEQVVYGLACEYPGNLSRSDFVDGFVHTYKKMFNEDITGQRSIEIFNELYDKKEM